MTFVIDEISEDLIISSLKLLSLNFKEVSLIYYDKDTELLNYIFTDHLNNFSKIRIKCLSLNISIASLFPNALFLEEKLEKLYSIYFQRQIKKDVKSNINIKYDKFQVDGLLENGRLLNSSCLLNTDYKEKKYISLDSILEDLSKLEFHSYIYQLMALFAFESSINIPDSVKTSRMFLLEIDKIKFLSSNLESYCKKFDFKFRSISDIVTNFVETCILRKNLLNKHEALFSENILNSYRNMFFEFRKEISKIKKVLVSSKINKIELANFIHPSCIHSNLVNGTLARSTGENTDLNYLNPDLNYSQFSKNYPQSNDRSSYSYLKQIFYELERSLDICLEILESNSLVEDVFIDYSFYDLNKLNSEVCYQLETGHGISTISLFKDENNKLCFQLTSESLKRACYYIENLKNYDFAMQNNLIEALNINYSEIF